MKPAPSPAERMDDAEFERLVTSAVKRSRLEATLMASLSDEQRRVYIQLWAERIAEDSVTGGLQAEARRAREENKTLRALAAFGKAIIEDYFNDGDFGDLDGGDVQEKAVEVGLLVHPEVAHDPNDCEGCSDEPRSCYVLSAAALGEVKP